MYLRIYFGNKPVYLCDSLDAELEEVLHHPDAIYIDEFSPPAIKSLLHEIKKDNFHAGVIRHSDLEALRKAFFKNFILIQAAGGLVKNNNNEILMLFRLGKWDLPKGKLDPGESLETCAIREVAEETGISDLTITAKLPNTYHTYDEFGKHILKETHWYAMRTGAEQRLVPQTTENIEVAEWGGPERMEQYLANTYPSVAELLQRTIVG